MSRLRTVSSAGVVLLATVGVVLACRGPVSAKPADARITSAVLGTDRVDKPNGYEIVGKATEFRPDTPKIVCVFTVDGAGIGMVVKGVWIAEDVGPVAPPNYKIAERSLRLPFLNSGSLTLTKPNNGWPVGSYRLEIYLGDTLAKTLKFTVKAA
jgi:hypothetical protein